jgi:hypothetical protein
LAALVITVTSLERFGRALQRPSSPLFPNAFVAPGSRDQELRNWASSFEVEDEDESDAEEVDKKPTEIDEHTMSKTLREPIFTKETVSVSDVD